MLYLCNACGSIYIYVVLILLDTMCCVESFLFTCVVCVCALVLFDNSIYRGALDKFPN